MACHAVVGVLWNTGHLVGGGPVDRHYYMGMYEAEMDWARREVGMDKEKGGEEWEGGEGCGLIRYLLFVKPAASMGKSHATAALLLPTLNM